VDTLPSRLNHARTLRGLSQSKLAELAGVSQSTVGNIEAGIRDGAASLAAIADALQVRYWWLRDGEGPMEPTKLRADAQAIAEAFDSLPVDTALAIDRRAWLYANVMGQIEAQRASAPTPPPPAPAGPPSNVRRLTTKTRP
jgi:transcriptional regulator with XRE-family HTH domain